jgi:hypothetical protein
MIRYIGTRHTYPSSLVGAGMLEYNGSPETVFFARYILGKHMSSGEWMDLARQSAKRVKGKRRQDTSDVEMLVELFEGTLAIMFHTSAPDCYAPEGDSVEELAYKPFDPADYDGMTNDRVLGPLLRSALGRIDFEHVAVLVLTHADELATV